MTERSRPWLAWLAVSALLAPAVCNADLDLAGFGTLGAAISDQDFKYQHYINKDGTLNRDSVIGFQLDGRFTPEWGVTIQAKAAPSDHRDIGWDPTLSWAFLSWRPTNDLLFRAGKLRIPLMLYSANADVGTTFDFARLPREVYSLTPTADAIGLSFGWTWLTGENEWTLEGYAGRAHTDWRVYQRDGLPPYVGPGPRYVGVDVNIGGLVMTLHQAKSTWRVGLHRADVKADSGGVTQTYPYVPIGPGIGYYQIDGSMPGPGVPKVNTVVNYIFTFGAEIALANDFKLVGEYARRRMTNVTVGADTSAAYLALLRPVGKWTPYLFAAGIRSSEKALDLYKALNDNRLPAYIPGADYLNATQRLGADALLPYEQYSFAIGSAYNITANSKIKAEWMHSRSETASSFFDMPPGEDTDHREVNVFSLSYNFTF